MTSKTIVRFAPWVGSRYQEGLGGLRVLLVCESHYGKLQHERPTVTHEIIKALALGERHPQAIKKLRKHPHFAKIMNAIVGVRRAYSREEKRAFWDSVAYYNFVQEFILTKRLPPTKDAWERAKRPFLEVLQVLQPDLIVCFSTRQSRYVISLSGEIPVAVVNHPSSRFAYSKVIPVITNVKASAQARKFMLPRFNSNAAFEEWSQATISAIATPGSHLTEPHKTALIEQRQVAMAAVDGLRLA